MNDDELDRIMREGLERRAASADTGRAAELVATALRAASPRRTPAVIALAAAAVAVVALGTSVLVQRDDAGRDVRPGGDPTSDGPTDGPTDGSVPGPGEWRLEQWRGIQVKVPADWGWGGAPQPDFVEEGQPPNDRFLDCGADAYLAADGTPFLNGDDHRAYVGRPVMQTDACNSFDRGDWQPPSAPYVWLGVEIEPGTVEFGNGYVMETRVVEGATVSVATKDAGLRAWILDSAGPAAGDCAVALERPAGTAFDEGLAHVTGMSVCVYRRPGDGPAELVQATSVGAGPAGRFREALLATDAASCATERDPFQREPFQWVQLQVHGADAAGDLDASVTETYVVHLGECSGITGAPQGVARLRETTVAPWAVGGVPAYITGGYGAVGSAEGILSMYPS